MDYRQAEKLLKRIEVSVPVKQRVLVAQAECRNQTIDGFAHGVTAAAEGATVARRLARERHATCLEHLAFGQRSLHLFGGHIAVDSLQHFAEDDIREPEALAIELGVQPICFGISRTLEIADPDGGIDDDHAYLASRSRRDALRSPCSMVLRTIGPCSGEPTFQHAQLADLAGVELFPSMRRTASTFATDLKAEQTLDTTANAVVVRFDDSDLSDSIRSCSIEQDVN